MDSLTQIWTWLVDPQNLATAAFLFTVFAAVVGGAWKLYTYFSKSDAAPKVSAASGGMPAGRDITARAGPGGTAIVTTGGVTVNVEAIVEQLTKSHHRELAGYEQREQEQRDQIKALKEAVTALANQKDQPDAPPELDDALRELEQGKPVAAESIFQEVLDRKAAEGEAANKQAAEAARHLGALAYLHDTQKALHAYRRAVELEPQDPEGWNELGHLLKRVGELDEASAAYQKVLSLGESSGNRSVIAVAYVNLGIVCKIRGDLKQAEAMSCKALALNEELGHKEGIAGAYSTLGIVYKTRGIWSRLRRCTARPWH